MAKSDGPLQKLIPVESFLHRIFPPGIYKDNSDRIVQKRIFKPRKDCTEVSLAFPLDWEAKHMVADRNWRMQLQGWAGFQPIMNFFDEYDDKAAVLDLFFEMAADWWGHYGGVKWSHFLGQVCSVSKVYRV
jgi:hypothetical protein